MEIKSRDIREPNELLTFIGEHMIDWPTIWYRGVRGHHKLLPKIFRQPGSFEFERWLLNNYRLRAAGYLPGSVIDDPVRLLCNAQHYGMRTRLLDWTSSLSVALYFCFETDVAEDIEIWLLDPHTLNVCARMLSEKTETLDTMSLFAHRRAEGVRLPTANQVVALAEWAVTGRSQHPRPLLPIAFHPEHFDRRLQAQRSMFTIHGLDTRAIDDLLPMCLETAALEQCLVCLRIAKENYAHIRKKTQPISLDASLVFPDLEGVVKEIEKEVSVI